MGVRRLALVAVLACACGGDTAGACGNPGGGMAGGGTGGVGGLFDASPSDGNPGDAFDAAND